MQESHTLLKLFLLVPSERTLASKQIVDLFQCTAGSFGEEAVYQGNVCKHGTSEMLAVSVGPIKGYSRSENVESLQAKLEIRNLWVVGRTHTFSLMPENMTGTKREPPP